MLWGFQINLYTHNLRINPLVYRRVQIKQYSIL